MYAVPKRHAGTRPNASGITFFSESLSDRGGTLPYGATRFLVIREPVYPVGDSLLYMEPLCTFRPKGGEDPRTQTVPMYYGGRVVVGTSVADALSRCLGKAYRLSLPAAPNPEERPTDLEEHT